MSRADVPPDWAELPDEQLLGLRLSDLPLKLEGTVVEGRIAQLRAELEARDLRFPLHFYLSDEWFTPDGTASMAVPFYLTHPRLERLEKASDSNELDRAYADIAADHLESMVQDYRDTRQKTQTPEIRRLIDDELPVIQDLLTRARQVDAKESQRDKDKESDKQ